MDEMLNKKDVLDAIEKKMKVVNEADGDADVVLGLAAAMSVVKKMEALKQEPCEDAISRQAVLDLIYNSWAHNGVGENYGELSIDALKALPPVNPTEKVGRWEQFGNFWEDKFKCSECGKEQPKILCGERIIGHWSDYCPYCGAKMQEVEE